MAELVEGAGLENQKGGNPFEGSNPSLSADSKTKAKALVLLHSARERGIRTEERRSPAGASRGPQRVGVEGVRTFGVRRTNKRSTRVTELRKLQTPPLGGCFLKRRE